MTEEKRIFSNRSSVSVPPNGNAHGWDDAQRKFYRLGRERGRCEKFFDMKIEQDFQYNFLNFDENRKNI